jgi:hypothetical protein
LSKVDLKVYTIRPAKFVFSISVEESAEMLSEMFLAPPFTVTLVIDKSPDP